MKKLLVRVVIAIVVVGGLYILSKRVFEPDPILIQAVLVARGRVEATVTNSKAGTIKARQRAHLSPEVSGRVAEIPHTEGQVVKEGTVLVRVDDSAQRAQLDLAKRSLDAAVALHDQSCLAATRALSELERNQKLATEGHISEDLLEQLLHNKDAADAACLSQEANVARARAVVTVADVEVAKTILRAPFDGILAELSLELGEWVSPSPPMLPVPSVVDIINPSSIYVSAPMDEVDSGKIVAGQTVRVTIDPYPGMEFLGKVVRVAPYVLDIESQNRTVEIEVELDDRRFAQTLLPGTSADVEVMLDVRDTVVRVPSSTLIRGNHVLMVEGAVLVEREVEVGLKNWEFVEICSGLTEGDLVVRSLDREGVDVGAEIVVEEIIDLSSLEDATRTSNDSFGTAASVRQDDASLSADRGVGSK